MTEFVISYKMPPHPSGVTDGLVEVAGAAV